MDIWEPDAGLVFWKISLVRLLESKRRQFRFAMPASCLQVSPLHRPLPTANSTWWVRLTKYSTEDDPFGLMYHSSTAGVGTGNDLASFLSPDETAYDIVLRHCRRNPRTGVQRLDRFVNRGNGFPAGQCITITGDPGSGKSTLLQTLMLDSILPCVSSRFFVVWDEAGDVSFDPIRFL